MQVFSFKSFSIFWLITSFESHLCWNSGCFLFGSRNFSGALFAFSTSIHFPRPDAIVAFSHCMIPSIFINPCLILMMIVLKYLIACQSCFSFSRSVDRIELSRNWSICTLPTRSLAKPMICPICQDIFELIYLFFEILAFSKLGYTMFAWKFTRYVHFFLLCLTFIHFPLHFHNSYKFVQVFIDPWIKYCALWPFDHLVWWNFDFYHRFPTIFVNFGSATMNSACWMLVREPISRFSFDLSPPHVSFALSDKFCVFFSRFLAVHLSAGLLIQLSACGCPQSTCSKFHLPNRAASHPSRFSRCTSFIHGLGFNCDQSMCVFSMPTSERASNFSGSWNLRHAFPSFRFFSQSHRPAKCPISIAQFIMSCLSNIILLPTSVRHLRPCVYCDFFRVSDFWATTSILSSYLSYFNWYLTLSWSFQSGWPYISPRVSVLLASSSLVCCIFVTRFCHFGLIFCIEYFFHPKRIQSFIQLILYALDEDLILDQFESRDRMGSSIKKWAKINCKKWEQSIDPNPDNQFHQLKIQSIHLKLSLIA